MTDTSDEYISLAQAMKIASLGDLETIFATALKELTGADAHVNISSFEQTPIGGAKLTVSLQQKFEGSDLLF